MQAGPSAQALIARLGIRLPIVQAPMAGVSSTAMAAAVTEAGGLGSLGLGVLGAEQIAATLADLRARTAGACNVNVFCHRPAPRDAVAEAAWLDALRPAFARFGAEPSAQLSELFGSFVADDAVLQVLVAARLPVVSFHFGLPAPAAIEALHAAGTFLLATATSLDEARAIERAGIDGIVAQGHEAGGHRGMFDPDAIDEGLSTATLTRLLVRHIRCPVIAAGGIMDGAGIAAALSLGAGAAQLGTAFIATDESLASAACRELLLAPAHPGTLMTRAISGRPARVLANRVRELDALAASADLPAYPLPFDAARSLDALARAAGDTGFGACWAGQGAPLARVMPAAQLVAELARELQQA